SGHHPSLHTFPTRRSSDLNCGETQSAIIQVTLQTTELLSAGSAKHSGLLNPQLLSHALLGGFTSPSAFRNSRLRFLRRIFCLRSDRQSTRLNSVTWASRMP